ncbi:MAG: polysaccharide biosynthesis/export family protein [Sphingobacteriaceae bacterium]
MKNYIGTNALIALSIPFLFFSSCVSQKQIAYFQKDTTGSDMISVAQTYIPKIQSGDILSINISSLNTSASSFFNPYGGVGLNDDAATSGAGNAPVLNKTSAPGFLVDEKGIIEIPLIGQVKVSDLTTSVARDTIKNRLKIYLKEPTVNIRFLNYKVSVMGEVMRPAVYVIPNERITLPEALSMAGDLSIYGKRDNVLIIRDNNGKKEFGRVNLNNREVFSSPYYYLHANDIVYVEQGKGKAAQADQLYRLLPIILSALSVFAIILTRLK